MFKSTCGVFDYFHQKAEAATTNQNELAPLWRNLPLIGQQSVEAPQQTISPPSKTQSLNAIKENYF